MDKKKNSNKPSHKRISFWWIAAITLFTMFLFIMFNEDRNEFSKDNVENGRTSGQVNQVAELNFSELMAEIEKGNIVAIFLEGSGKVKGQFKTENGKVSEDQIDFESNIPFGDTLRWAGELRKEGVVVKQMPAEGSGWASLLTWLPLALILGVWIFFMNRAQKKQMGTMDKMTSMGKSKVDKGEDDADKVLFKDVAGVDEAKEEVQEIVEFLKNSGKFSKLGAKIPTGVLLMGPHGTGKTLLAQAIAGEADVPFFNLSGSDFVEKLVGIGAGRVRDLFKQAKKDAPCIVFIDEIDAVGRHRGAGLGGGNDEREQTLNQLLVEMDGFKKNSGVIVIAATNRPDILDPALLRPGRFDRKVVVQIPDLIGREQILKIHTGGIPIDNSVDLKIIARGTPGFSGADIANLANEAALFAARQEKEKITAEDFEEAKDKIMMGPERKNLVMSDSEKKNTAYHEAGHAVVASKSKNADPVHKVTIIPRGRALGVTMSLPKEDKFSHDDHYLNDQLAVLLGGRAAEELFLHHKTTGAGDDIERANDLAEKMVKKWGMSDLGLISCGKNEEQVFLGRDIQTNSGASEKMKAESDDAARKIVKKSYERAVKILEDNKDQVKKLAEALLERETLDGEEIKNIVN